MQHPLLAEIDWSAFLINPFTGGLAIGLLVAFFTWKSGFSSRGHLKRETKRLTSELKEMQGHLNTQLKINASGNEALTKQVEELRDTNENLRVNLAALQSKPGKAEIRQLHMMERAVSMMREQAPGFAQAWEQALRNAEEEHTAAESGIKKLVRKVLPAIGTSGPSQTEETHDEEEKQEERT